MSKMPALARSAKSVASKVCLNPSVCGSVDPGLKSATAMRMLETPVEVRSGTLSCARMDEAAGEQENQDCETRTLGVSCGRMFVAD